LETKQASLQAGGSVTVQAVYLCSDHHKYGTFPSLTVSIP
jgi:hypothetical protein